MDEDLRSATIQSRNIDHYPIYAFRGKESSHSFFKKDAVIIICDVSLDIYRIGTLSLKNSFFWPSISFLSFQKDTISLKFDTRLYKSKESPKEPKRFIIQSQFAQKAFFVIGHILHQLLYESELSRLNISQYPFENPGRTGMGALLRIQINGRYSEYSIPEVSISHMRQITSLSPPSVSLISIPDPAQFVPIFIDTIPLFDFIQSLITPSFDGLFSKSYRVDSLLHLKFIQIEGSFSLKEISEIKKRGCSNLIGFSFVNSSLDSIEGLPAIVTSLGLTSIGLHNALSQSAQQYLYSSLQNISVLSLDNTLGISIDDLFQKIPTVKVLSLAGCQLQVSKILEGCSRITGLQSLNISGNIATLPISPSLNLPIQLFQMCADEIRWGSSQNLIGFLSIFIRRIGKAIKLSISKTGINSQKLDLFFEKVRCLDLSDFAWDGNPISQSLISFLSNNSMLSSLSFDGCFPLDEDTSHSFANLISSLPNLKTLSMRGGTVNRSVLKASFGCQTLDLLDISDSAVSESSLLPFFSLIQLRIKPLTLIMDKIRPTDTLTYLGELSGLLALKKWVKLSYPVEDLTNLLSGQDITRDQFIGLVDQFRLPFQRSELGVDSPFLSPYKLFYYQRELKFPQFLSLEEINKNAASSVIPLVKNEEQKFSTVGRPKRKVVSQFDTEPVHAPYGPLQKSKRPQPHSSPIQTAKETPRVKAPSRKETHTAPNLGSGEAPLKEEKSFFNISSRKRSNSVTHERRTMTIDLEDTSSSHKKHHTHLENLTTICEEGPRFKFD